MQRPGSQEERRQGLRFRRRNPGKKRGEKRQERDLVEALHRWHGQTPRTLTCQPVAGEGRHDPSADDRNHHQRRTEASP